MRPGVWLFETWVKLLGIIAACSGTEPCARLGSDESRSEFRVRVQALALLKTGINGRFEDNPKTPGRPKSVDLAHPPPWHGLIGSHMPAEEGRFMKWLVG